MEMKELNSRKKQEKRKKEREKKEKRMKIYRRIDHRNVKKYVYIGYDRIGENSHDN